MTATTDLTAQIAILNRVLADATVECPECEGTRISLGSVCDFGCKGSGRIACFPGFRQECKCYKGDPHTHLYTCFKCLPMVLGGSTFKHSSDCLKCNGTGWQVRAGGLEDSFKGLESGDFSKVLEKLDSWRLYRSPRPTAPEILAEGLRLVIEVAGLGVPDA